MEPQIEKILRIFMDIFFIRENPFYLLNPCIYSPR